MSNHGRSCDCSVCASLNRQYPSCHKPGCPCLPCAWRRSADELASQYLRDQVAGHKCPCGNCAGYDEYRCRMDAKLRELSAQLDALRGGSAHDLAAAAMSAVNLSAQKAPPPPRRRFWQPCMPGYWYGFAVGLLGNLIVLALLRMLG